MFTIFHVHYCFAVAQKRSETVLDQENTNVLISKYINLRNSKSIKEKKWVNQ